MKKRCNVCGKSKDATAGFYQYKRRLKSGEVRQYPRSLCKECDKKKSDEWNRANREKINKRRGPETRTPEELRKYHRNYHRVTRGKGLRVWKKYRHELKELDPRVPKGPLVVTVKKSRRDKREEFIRPANLDSARSRGSKKVDTQFDRARFAAYLNVTMVELAYLERIGRSNSPVKTVPLSLVDRIYTALGLTYMLPVDYPVPEGQAEARAPGNSRAA